MRPALRPIALAIGIALGLPVVSCIGANTLHIGRSQAVDRSSPDSGTSDTASPKNEEVTGTAESKTGTWEYTRFADGEDI
jgi:hypothetical protein